MKKGTLIFFAVVLLAYLHEPPWTGSVTSGLRGWERDPRGIPFRWTTGRASFFVPSENADIGIPLRALTPPDDPRPFRVDVLVDDQLVDRVVLSDAVWTVARLRLSALRTRRRFRRIDLRIDHAWGDLRLGVQVGELDKRRSPPSRVGW